MYGMDTKKSLEPRKPGVNLILLLIVLSSIYLVSKSWAYLTEEHLELSQTPRRSFVWK